MDGIEWIKAGEQTLAVIIRAGVEFPQTTFITPPEFTQQGGFVVYPKDGQVATHSHRPIERHLTGTAETLFIRKGNALLKLYDDRHKLVAERTIATGDILMLVSGGHGLTMLEDTVLFEIKQGPYTGLDEKERFDDPSQ